jgi:glycerol-3-phosphate dehydrogenase (NAD(P)+)
MNISVIGAGGWGTALANLLAEKGYDVKSWAYEKEGAENINIHNENKQYLKDKRLSRRLIATTKLDSIVPDSDVIISAVPSAFVRATAKKIAPMLKDKEYNLVSVSKGLEHETFKLMTQVLKDELPENVKIAALSGPNHAEEVALRMPTATVIASVHKDILPKLTELFRVSYFKPYGITDEYGVEICGAVKNITAIAIGVCDGLGFGDNTKASIMTLGLTEMNEIGKEFGVKRKTFFGLAGVGDMIATCTSKHSRNRFFGEQLAKGKSAEEIKREMKGMVAEGYYTVRSVYEFSKRKNIDLPLTSQAYQVLYEGKLLPLALKELLKQI